MIVYKVTNLANGMSYIGQTAKSLETRKYEHGIQANHTNFYFHRALKKYGEDKFEWEIIKRCKSHNELTCSEQLFIKQFNTKVPDGYNMTAGGEGTPNRIIRDETRLKLRIANLGKHPSEETRKKLSDSHKGHQHSEETRRKMSKALMGNTHCVEHKQSEETKRKRSESLKGHKGYWLGRSMPIEMRRKKSESVKKSWATPEAKLRKKALRKFMKEHNPQHKAYVVEED